MSLLNKKLLEDYLKQEKDFVELIEFYNVDNTFICAKYIEKDGTHVTDLTISLFDLISFVYSKNSVS